MDCRERDDRERRAVGRADVVGDEKQPSLAQRRVDGADALAPQRLGERSDRARQSRVVLDAHAQSSRLGTSSLGRLEEAGRLVVEEAVDAVFDGREFLEPRRARPREPPSVERPQRCSPQRLEHDAGAVVRRVLVPRQRGQLAEGRDAEERRVGARIIDAPRRVEDGGVVQREAHGAAQRVGHVVVEHRRLRSSMSRVVGRRPRDTQGDVVLRAASKPPAFFFLVAGLAPRPEIPDGHDDWPRPRAALAQHEALRRNDEPRPPRGVPVSLRVDDCSGTPTKAPAAVAVIREDRHKDVRRRGPPRGIVVAEWRQQRFSRAQPLDVRDDRGERGALARRREDAVEGSLQNEARVHRRVGRGDGVPDEERRVILCELRFQRVECVEDARHELPPRPKVFRTRGRLVNDIVDGGVLPGEEPRERAVDLGARQCIEGLAHAALPLQPLPDLENV
mmetsp:Transcript_21180/g.84402  ORF Transcript_21180/g.84402 Transcript_21180/m.84402 type:complete len:449 (+) Transcript_21180:1256-2602(+)